MDNTIEDQELKILLKTLASKSGTAYFETLVLELSNIVSAQYIFIGELEIESNSIRTIALCKEGQLLPNFEYKLKGTPCNNVIEDSVCFYKQNVQRLFPDDLLLAEMKIQSYLGLPLHDRQGYPHAILVFLDEKPKKENFPLENSFLEILSIIIGTELSKNKTEALLKEREEKFRVTLDSIVDAVIVTNENGCISRMNSIAEELTGFDFNKDQQMLLSNVLDIHDSITNEKLEFPLHKLLFKDEPINRTKNTYLINKEGDTKQISYSGAPIHNDKGDCIGSILILNDITKTHDLEMQLQHSQKMLSIGKLAGGIAHDFNNILGGILGCAEIIKRKVPNNDIITKYIGHIIKASERSAGLTRQLLDFSRQGKIHSTTLHIHDIIDETIVLLESTIDKQIKIKSNLDAKSDLILGDPSQIQNSILNLCINASDAIKGNGSITINSSEIDIAKTLAKNLNLPFPGTYIQLDVIDSGEGIDKTILPHIFDPFYTTKETGEGTGLGLSAVYGAIKDHLGSIHVSSEINKGTTFSIYLPITADEKPLVSDSKVTAYNQNAETKNILIIDDEELIRESVKFILEDSGYHVLLAQNGEEALEIFNKNQKKIDLVILDFVMPILNGADVFNQIREKEPNLPLLFSSGFSRDAKVESLMDKSTHFIQKPYNAKELIQAINFLKSEASKN